MLGEIFVIKCQVRTNIKLYMQYFSLKFLYGSVISCNAGDTAGTFGFHPESGRSLGGGNGNPLQYSCLGNPMDRGAFPATVPGVAKKSDMTYCLNNSSNMQYTEKKYGKKHAKIETLCGRVLADYCSASYFFDIFIILNTVYYFKN